MKLTAFEFWFAMNEANEGQLTCEMCLDAIADINQLMLYDLPDSMYDYLDENKSRILRRMGRLNADQN
jgi:hypothetical protein